MTKAEKRYFHQLTQSHRVAPNYWLVYQAIMEMDKWESNALGAKLEEATFKAHLPVVKHQLYERILDSLHLFYRENEVEEQIKRSIHQAYLLYKRNMRQEAAQRIDKCRSRIAKLQLWHLLPECLEVQRLVNARSSGRNSFNQELREWQENYQEGLAALSGRLPVAAFRAKVTQTHLQKVRPTGDVISELEAELKRFPVEGDRLSQADLLQCRALLAFMKRNPSEAQQANSALLRVLESLPSTQRSIAERYLSTLYNHLIDQLQLGNELALREGLAKLRSLSGQKGFRQLPGIDVKIFEWSYQLELNLYAAQKEYQQMLLMLPQLKAGLQKYDGELSVPAQAGLRHLCGLGAFQASEPSVALEFLTPLYQARRPELAGEIYHYATLLYLLCHYELDHRQLLDHLLVNTQRQIRSQAVTRIHSEQVLSYLRRALHAPDKGAKAAVFEEWLDQLPAEPSPIETYLALRHWILGKLGRDSSK